MLRELPIKNEWEQAQVIDAARLARLHNPDSLDLAVSEFTNYVEKALKAKYGAQNYRKLALEFMQMYGLDDLETARRL